MALQGFRRQRNEGALCRGALYWRAAAGSWLAAWMGVNEWEPPPSSARVGSAYVNKLWRGGVSSILLEGILISRTVLLWHAQIAKRQRVTQ